MVVLVGGSFAYIPGDGILTFEDHVRTVGELRAAIQERTQIPGIKQVRENLASAVQQCRATAAVVFCLLCARRIRKLYSGTRYVYYFTLFIVELVFGITFCFGDVPRSC